jgi:hypothetical protein
MMNKDQKEKYVGLASLFAPEQLRGYFLNYIYFIIGVEIFIFLVSFMSHLGPGKGPFPWKFYFYVALIIPVAITFLLGLFIMAFNRFIFGQGQAPDEAGFGRGEEGESKSRILKFGSLIRTLTHVPFVPTLFVIVLGAAFVYKFDDIFRFILQAGEKTVTYLLIGAAVLLGAGIIIAIMWVISNYKLNKRHMEHEYQYRKDVMNTMGFLILDDNMVINKEGKLIAAQPELPLLEGSATEPGKVKSLPSPVSNQKTAAGAEAVYQQKEESAG